MEEAIELLRLTQAKYEQAYSRALELNEQARQAEFEERTALSERNAAKKALFDTVIGKVDA